MHWINEHLDQLVLFVALWAGVTDIVHGVKYAEPLQMQVGFIWIALGVMAYKI